MLYIDGYGIMGAVIKACGGCGGGGGGLKQKKKITLRPVVISGPSGSGKSTLVKRLLHEHSDIFAYSVSHTTRAARPGEKDGTDYHFVSMEEMMKLIDEDGFIEHAKFAGHIYGTSKKALEDVMNSGRICVLDIDMMGVKSMKRTKFNARYICIKAPSLEILKERLRGRGTEKENVISLRILNAVAALEFADMPGSYDHVIVNDDLETAYAELESILAKDIEEAQRLQQIRRESET